MGLSTRKGPANSAMTMAEPERGWRYELVNVLILNKLWMGLVHFLFFSKPHRNSKIIQETNDDMTAD